eukprot:COSAG02_NODE_1064_length_14845_cov_137.957616_5_plen_198_part_00
MFCIPYCKESSNGKVYGSVSTLEIPVPKGQATPKWVEVGSRLDTMNDGTWEFTAKVMKKPPPPPAPKPAPGKKPPPPPPPPPPFAPAYTIQFGVAQAARFSLNQVRKFSHAFYTDGTISRSAFHRCTARHILTKIFFGSLRLWETYSTCIRDCSDSIHRPPLEFSATVGLTGTGGGACWTTGGWSRAGSENSPQTES